MAVGPVHMHIHAEMTTVLPQAITSGFSTTEKGSCPGMDLMNNMCIAQSEEGCCALLCRNEWHSHECLVLPPQQQQGRGIAHVSAC